LASAPAVAGHAEIHRRLFDAFELETPIEIGARPFILHRRLIIDPAKDRLDGVFGPSVTHHDEVPGLHEADRPGMVRRSQQSRQHVIRYRGGQKSPTHIAPLENGPVHGASLHRRKPVTSTRDLLASLNEV
jgi:hypothetical protein